MANTNFTVPGLVPYVKYLSQCLTEAYGAIEKDPPKEKTIIARFQYTWGHTPDELKRFLVGYLVPILNEITQIESKKTGGNHG